MCGAGRLQVWLENRKRTKEECFQANRAIHEVVVAGREAEGGSWTICAQARVDCWRAGLEHLRGGLLLRCGVMKEGTDSHLCSIRQFVEDAEKDEKKH